LIENTNSVKTEDVPEGLLKANDPYAQHKEIMEENIKKQVKTDSNKAKFEDIAQD
jgi:hypothetical protein